MAYVKIWIHVVWGTKNHHPFLTKEKRKILFQHIRENAKKKQIFIDTIDGHVDHVHCLLLLNADMSISTAVNLLKGEASWWANKKSKLFDSKFEWADEYFAASVSDSVADKVRAYILNQQEHHRKKTFAHEYEEFLKTQGLSITAKADTNTITTSPAINGGVNNLKSPSGFNSDNI